jgi:futalosine hydrolase
MPLLEQMDETHNSGTHQIECKFNSHEILFLITGVGMVPTTYYTSRILDESFDLAINIGVCGSFNRNIEIGEVVAIYEDHFSELGAEDGDEFLSLNDLGLTGVSSVRNSTGALHEVIDSLPKVSGITVNTTHGNEISIGKVYERLHPYVESMEGAAFMFVCEQERVPYVQLRGVSNYVERRNKLEWNLPLAIENVNKKVLEFLKALN